MSDARESQAIEAALKNDWESALEINSAILAENPNDLEAMNRLGKAHLELGNTKKAITIFKNVLKVNQYDAIAAKNLLRASHVPSKKSVNVTNAGTISFLEEPGKTKMVTLVNVAPTKTLFNLRCADCVLLAAKKHAVFIESQDGTYLGALPDDLGHRLLILIKGGNFYEAFVKSVSKGSLVLFIKEKSRSKKFKSTPSFPSGNSEYLSFVREESTGSDESTSSNEKEGSEEEDEVTFKKSERLHEDEMPEEN